MRRRIKVKGNPVEVISKRVRNVQTTKASDTKTAKATKATKTGTKTTQRAQPVARGRRLGRGAGKAALPLAIGGLVAKEVKAEGATPGQAATAGAAAAGGLAGLAGVAAGVRKHAKGRKGAIGGGAVFPAAGGVIRGVEAYQRGERGRRLAAETAKGAGEVAKYTVPFELAKGVGKRLAKRAGALGVAGKAARGVVSLPFLAGYIGTEQLVKAVYPKIQSRMQQKKLRTEIAATREQERKRAARAARRRR
jgi:hypothetical protein